MIAGVTHTLDVPEGPSFLRFGGENVHLGVLGNEIVGTFSVEESGDNVSVDIDDASVSLAGGLVSARADDRRSRSLRTA